MGEVLGPGGIFLFLISYSSLLSYFILFYSPSFVEYHAAALGQRCAGGREEAYRHLIKIWYNTPPG